LYLHVFDWPAGGELLVPRLRSKPTEAYLLAARNNKLSLRQTAAGLIVSVPHVAPSPFSSVVVLTIAGEPDVEPITFALGRDGTTTLTAVDATLHGRELRCESGDHRNNVGYWSDPSEWVSWPIRIDRPGTFAVTAEIASLGTGRFDVVLGGSKLSATAPNTGDWGNFVTVELGTLKLSNTGIVTLEVRPQSEGWSPINLRSVTLKLKQR
jgi:alpha-L-fucosidase